MIVTTTFSVEGYRVVEHLGLVRGIIVRSPTIAQGFFAGIKNIIGGQIGAFTDMCEQARAAAYLEMVRHAEQLGANAIVGARYDGSDVSSGNVNATEVLCYGTAVILEKI